VQNKKFKLSNPPLLQYAQRYMPFYLNHHEKKN